VSRKNFKNNYMTKEEAIIKSEEIWDKYSEHIDTDIDSLSNYAGRVVLTREQYDRGILELAVFIMQQGKPIKRKRKDD
jgi:hypothetical protein